MTNTKSKGKLSFLIFKVPGEDEFTGVCLQLAMVKMDSDPERLQKDITDAAMGYVETVGKNNLSADLLNQSHKLSSFYLDLFDAYARALQLRSPGIPDNVIGIAEDSETRAFVQPLLAAC